MGTYTIEKLVNEPIIYCWFSALWRAEELPAVFDEVAAMLDETDEPLILITSAQSINLSLEDVIATANLAAKGGNALLHHPNLREFVFVTGIKMLQMAASGLDSAVFGHVPVEIYETEEEALSYAREKISSA